MVRFACKVALLALALLLSHLLFYVLLPPDPGSGAYLGAINDKYARLAAIPSPKLIFVGSSELAFGLDSARVEEALGMPVANMGLHAGIGIRTTLESIRSYIGPGDIVLVSAALDPIPDSFFYGYDDATGEHLWLLKMRPSLIYSLNTPQQWQLLVKEYPNFLKIMKGNLFGSRFRSIYLPTPQDAAVVYRRAAFNQYGDLVGHLNVEPISKPQPQSQARAVDPETLFPAIPLTPEATAYLNDYYAFVNARGASMYAIWPPQYTPQNSEPTTPFVTVQNLAIFASRKSDILVPVIGSPQDYEYPIELFYESPGHLNRQGRAARTEQLIKDLSPLFLKGLPSS